jgi:hypothetical protein
MQFGVGRLHRGAADTVYIYSITLGHRMTSSLEISR